jgi:hypothetical protein
MPELESTAIAPFRHVYRLNAARLLLLPIVGLSFCALLAGAGLSDPSDAESMRVYLLTAGILTVIMLPFIGVLWQSRLVLTHEGIAHHQLGYTVRSTWQNLEALSLERRAESLYLHEPGTRSKLLRGSSNLVGAATPGRANSVVGDTAALSQGRLIFLAPFMSHWKRGPLQEDLRRCAPHLF